MISFAKDYESIVKAFLLSRITGDMVVFESHESTDDRPLLFTQNAVTNSNDYHLKDLISQYNAKFKRNMDWLKGVNGKELKDTIILALRNSSEKKYTIIFHALEDCFSKGISCCLAGGSEKYNKLKTLSSEVRREIWRMLGFVRFKSYSELCLITKPKLYHDTADLLLVEFQNRYPNHRIVVITDTVALAIQDGEISNVNRYEYENFVSEDDYDSMWKEYYKSQYIEERKNIKYTAKSIPKKYWDWMVEGIILEEEQRK